MNFETFTKTLARDYRTESLDIHLCVTLYEVLSPLLKPERTLPEHANPVVDSLAQTALTLPNVIEHIDEGRKIQAIKELREYRKAVDGVHPGLKECKDAVEHVQTHLLASGSAALLAKLMGEAPPWLSE